MKKHFLLWALLLFCTLPILAYDFEVDGIYYKKLGGDSVAVTYGSFHEVKEIFNYNGEYQGSITIPETVNFESVSYRVVLIGEFAFAYAGRLSSVTLPNSIKTIGFKAFRKCTFLYSITIPNSVTFMDLYVFQDCDGLRYVTLSDNLISIGEGAFYNCSSLRSIQLPSSLKSLSMRLFSGCSNLESITIPEKVTEIGNDVFSGCQSLTTITIPNSVTKIGQGAFWSCRNLSSLTIGENVTSIGELAFGECYALTSITIPDNVTSIGDNTFYYCSHLDSVIIGNGITQLVANQFEGCPNITFISIGKSVTTISSSTFKQCSLLTSVVWNGIRCNNFSSYKNGPFYSMRKNITSFTFGDAVQSIPDYLCDEMSSLTSITIPDKVTYIGKSAFYGCSGLTSINIPASVTTINGSYAFYQCTNITDILLGSSTPPTWASSLDELNRDINVFVPCGSANAYLADTTWTNRFTHFIESDSLSQFVIRSNNTMMGNVIIQKHPTCDNPTAIVQAEPREGHSFVSWNDGNTDAIRSIEVTGNIEYTANFVREPNYKITLHVQKPDSWDAIYLYTWLNNGSQPHGAWPGTKMTEVNEDGWYYYTFHQSVTDVNYIFNYGSDIWKTKDLHTNITTYTILEETGNDYKVFTTAELEDEYGNYTPKSCVMKADWVAECEITDVRVEPTDSSAAFTWPAVEGASSYVLVIWADAEQTEKICTLTFNAEGHLTNIDFSRNKPASSHETILSGLNFTVTGLTAGTTYTYSLSSYDNTGAQIENKIGTFTTTGTTGIEDIFTPAASDSVRKVFENGTIYILRNGEKYTIDGIRVM